MGELKMKNKLLAAISLLFILLFIFGNSSRDGVSSNNFSRNIIQKVIVSQTDSNEENIDNAKDYNWFIYNLNIVIRKFAHAIEFCVLAIILSIVINSFKVETKLAVVSTMFIVLLLAVFDEFYQIYIPGRNSNVRDVLIDFIGGIIGISIFYISKLIFKVIKNKRLNKNINIVNRKNV